MNRLILLFSLFSFFSCSIDRTVIEISENENNTLINFQNLPWESILKITNKNEPGEKLILCLTFIDKASKKELSNQLVKFHHTSALGDYEQTDPNDESTARLNGQSVTDNKGQIYVETILPGDYGSSDDNRHIHTTVFGARPETYDIHFKQYTGFMGTNFIKDSDQHAVIIQGELTYVLPQTQEQKLLDAGSYFSSRGKSIHTISNHTQQYVVLYLRTDGEIRID